MSIGISAALGAEVEQLRHDADRYQQVIADLTSELSRLHVDCHNLQQRVNGFYGGAPLSRIETVELRQENERLRAELASSASRVSELTSALTLAIDLVDHWGSYASEYFQQKHDLAGDLATLRAALREGGK